MKPMRGTLRTLGRRLILCLVIVVTAPPLLPTATAYAKDTLGEQGRALLLDVRKQVAIQMKKSWKVDNYEIEAMMPDALLSLCRTDEKTRATVVAFVRAKIDELGGPVEEAFVRNNRDLDSVHELLEWTRVLLLLQESIERAPKECPFWLGPEQFSGSIHRNTNRFSINFEGGGLLGLRRQSGVTYFGGGGCSRLTIARGLSEHWAVRGGVEFGGSALLDESVQAQSANVDFFGATPFVLRHMGVLWQQDLEVAPIFVGIPWRGSLQYGVRFGTLIGFSYLRVGNILPWGGLVITWEYLFERDSNPSMWTVRMGFRLGFDWSPLD